MRIVLIRKKLTALMLAALLAFGLCGCGISDEGLLGTWIAAEAPSCLGEITGLGRIEPSSISFYSDGSFSLERSAGGCQLFGSYALVNDRRIIHFTVENRPEAPNYHLYCSISRLGGYLTITGKNGISVTFTKE